MSFAEGERLARLSIAVRDSTIRRLKLVPEGSENWRIDKDAMSFADLGQHIIDADKWLFKMLEVKSLPRMQGRAGLAQISSRDEYLRLIEKLNQIGETRRKLFEHLSDEQLSETIYDERFGGEVSAWWVIVRGNLDHETHHRGQIAAYLRALGSKVISDDQS